MPILPIQDKISPQDTFSQRPVARELDRDAFLKILVAQLRNQDPLNPIEDKDFIAQMAQFSLLEQMQSLNEGFRFSQATGLIGKHVYAEYTNELGAVERLFGKVTSVMSIGGQPYLEVNGVQIPYTSQVVVYDYADPQAPQAGDYSETEAGVPETDPGQDPEPADPPD